MFWEQEKKTWITLFYGHIQTDGPQREMEMHMLFWNLGAAMGSATNAMGFLNKDINEYYPHLTWFDYTVQYVSNIYNM